MHGEKSSGRRAVSRSHFIAKENRQLQLNYALAAAALKNTVPGDFNLSTHEEIMDVVEERYDTKTLYKDYE